MLMVYIPQLLNDMKIPLMYIFLFLWMKMNRLQDILLSVSRFFDGILYD